MSIIRWNLLRNDTTVWFFKSSTDCGLWTMDYEPRRFFPSSRSPEATTNTHVSTYFGWSLGASVIYTQVGIVGFFVKTAMIHQLKRLCVPDCTYTESMFINFISRSLYSISPMQTILYELKRDMAVWKRLGCPQRTWWQIVATPYMGLRELARHILKTIPDCWKWIA